MKAGISFSAALSLSLWTGVGVVDAFWRMNCGLAQTGRIDPIINPGAISGHVHILSGASNVNTTSDFDSLTAAACTSCSIQKDKSAYWTPLLYYQRANGSFVDVPNDGTVVYYLGRGEDRRNIIPFPPGLRMLSGNPSKRSYDNSTMTYGNSTYRARPVADRVSFACINYAQATPETPNMATTDCPNGLRAQIQFPSCWDGVNLYKPDQSHVAYMSQIDNGVCPPTHPNLLPHLFYEIYYFPTRLDTSDGGTFVFSQGDTTGYGFHGDFMNGWDAQILSDAIAQCINDVDSGNISDCPPLQASQDEYYSTNCPEQPALVNEQVKGELSKLPGCNEVTSGPDDVPQGICATQPSLNPVVDTDGETTTVPVANVTSTTLSSGNTALYQGCYVEATDSRALSGASYTNSSGMTSVSCGTFCQSKGFGVFGTEYSKECYCGSAIATATTDQSDCGMVCSGNRTEYCGGPSRLSVWSIVSGTESGASSTTTSTTSASPTSTPTPSISGATYMGCYSDNTGGRTLASRTTDANMTLELCAQTAQAANHKYFGLEYAGECWAGDTMAATAAPITEAKCNMKCKGDTTQLCGGSNALTMFQNTLFVQPANPSVVDVTTTQAQYTYVGCYTEGSSGRSLGSSGSSSSSYSTTNANNMTVELCVQTCNAKGYSWAGVEYSKECYCNNAGVVNGGAAAPGGDADCSMICVGNLAEYCGGSSRISVYHLQTTGTVQRRHSHFHHKRELRGSGSFGS
ncbi:hypothetical protein A1O3_00478 [Capronia epimyces CBS 606.96]|uniref:WSC domain-containing protein n=1 Tax=Capronia epimyces CBS 606.96 TaxID=1182542 RepID=W9YHC4_9EURO|nr:uncharacterized protein A1O3_00478 [Capronia epimyces CBS 606.96]EXJ91928.1 hypothetical protein A1O3_00478 [Capronia epimyces CBS 606.96]